MRSVSERRRKPPERSPEGRAEELSPLPVELLKRILSRLAPGEFRLTHVWTPELELVLLKPSRNLKRRWGKRDFEAISIVVEKLCERAGRPTVVEVQ